MNQIIVSAALFFLVPQFALAANLNCSLREKKVLVASDSHAISVERDPSSFRFNLALIGPDYEASVAWHTEHISLSLKKKTDSLGSSQGSLWEKPFDDFFSIGHGDAILSCQVDVNDNRTWLWKDYRKQFGSDAIGIDDFVNHISKIARSNPENSKEEAEVNSGACLEIGNLQNAFWVNDVIHKLVGLDTVTGRKIFPDAYDLYLRLQIKIMGMMNFCGHDVVKDPNPVGYQNRQDLADRCDEIIKMDSNLLKYLDQHFPNN